MEPIEPYLHSWNPRPPGHLKSVLIEDDSLRDGLQGAFTRKPTLQEKVELMQRCARVGVQRAMLGFPAISDKEYAECKVLLEQLRARELPLVPKFLARARIPDVEPIVQLYAETQVPLWVDFWIAASPLRRRVERWELADLLGRVRETGRYLTGKKIRWAFSLEDSTRTPPEDLEAVFTTAMEAGASELVVCDTVGESNPAGSASIFAHTKELASRKGWGGLLSWHGHNDRGLAVANALAVAEAGAHVISGSFLGIGERTGCTPIEQVILYLHQTGNRLYRVDQLYPMCQELSRLTEVPIPDNAPVVGRQTFATCTGTHVSAILKGRELGRNFEDLVFSSVPAVELGREQDILVGPTSGLAAARHVLEKLELPGGDALARELLEHAKQQSRWLTPDDVLHFCQGAR